MPENVMYRIAHPTDFTRGSEIAFHHALKIAVASGAELDVLHVDREPHMVIWEEFPDVRETLAAWGAHNGDRGVQVRKVSEYGTDPVSPILKHLDEFPADLIVLATHRREGFDRWLHKTIAQKIARERSTATLFVPYGVNGFVSGSTGILSLRQVLIPVAWEPPAQPAIDLTAALLAMLGCAGVDLTVLHVGGDDMDMPMLDLPARKGWNWRQSVEPGELVETILAAASRIDADLIVMPTQGHEGFLDALRGSTTEQVLNQSKCPLLAVPVLVY